MPKTVPPLSEHQINDAMPGEKEYKLFDGGGLYLLVTPTGGKLWRMKFRHNNRENSLSFGEYPAVSLSDARQRREDAKRLLTNGIDPGKVNKEMKEAEKAKLHNVVVTPRVSISMDGVVEIWKGRNVIQLSRQEAAFIKEQLTLLT